MKRIFMLTGTVMGILVLISGCSPNGAEDKPLVKSYQIPGESPEKAVSNTLDHLKVSDVISIVKSSDMTKREGNDRILENMLSMRKYNILSGQTVVNNNFAIVKTEFSNKDVKKITGRFLREKVESDALSSGNFEKQLIEYMNSQNESTAVTIDIEVNKMGGDWYMEVDEPIVNAILGGYIDMIKNTMNPMPVPTEKKAEPGQPSESKQPAYSNSAGIPGDTPKESVMAVIAYFTRPEVGKMPVFAIENPDVVKEVYSGLTYQILNKGSSRHQNSAVVRIHIQNRDMKNVFKKLYMDFVEQYVQSSKGSDPRYFMTEQRTKVLVKEIRAINKMAAQTIDIRVSKIKGKWYARIARDFLSAIMGGAAEVLYN